MKKTFLLALLVAASAAQSQNLRIVPARLDTTVPTPKTIQFLCTQNYNQQQCVEDATTLRQALAHYPLRRLGAWSFVLVPADDWKALVRGQGGDPVSPAFSMLDQRVTLLDRSLFVASAGRNKEFLQRFGLIGAPLIDLAVTHEMGHGICQNKDERRADDYGKALRNSVFLDYSETPGQKPNNVTNDVPIDAPNATLQ